MNAKVKKGIDIGLIVLVCLIFILGIMMLSISLTQNKDRVPRFMGVTFLDVQSGSMEDTINEHDLAIIKKVKSVDDLKVDDIITFWIIKDGEKVLNTHRIVEIVAVSANVDANLKVFRTKGDANLNNDADLVKFDDVVGRYSFRLRGIGHVVGFLKSFWGFFTCIILPLLAFLIYRIIILVKVIYDMKRAKTATDDGDIDALKSELEALRAKVAGLDGASPDVVDSTDNVSDKTKD